MQTISHCKERLKNTLFPAGSLRRRGAQFILSAPRLLKALFRSQNRHAEGRLLFAIESDLAEPFAVGRGNVYLLKGWCYHTTLWIKQLYVIVSGTSYKISNYALARKDVHGKEDVTGNSLCSGFWVTVPFAAVDSRRQASFLLRAVLSDGSVVESEAGGLMLEPGMLPSPVPGVMQGGEGLLVAICMTTYNPTIELFEKQVDSLIRQTYKNWIAIVCDDHSDNERFEKIRTILKRDERFWLTRNPANVGLNRNFEKCLSLVPGEAAFIAIADQDDRWHDNKLSVLLSGFGSDSETLLVYSDMNIVDEKGTLVSDTYWTTRKNNFTELDLLILANTITGASCMFKRALLDYVLPFPPMEGLYYDNVIGCIALAQGHIAYLEDRLYDYYQHSCNVIGHCVSSRQEMDEEIPALCNFRNLKNIKKILAFYYDKFYFAQYPKRVVLSRLLQMRCKLAGGKKTVVDRFRSLESSSKGVFMQVVKDTLLMKKDVVMGIDIALLRSVIAGKVMNLYYPLKRKLLASGQPSHASSSESLWDNSKEQYCRDGFKIYWETLPEVRKYQLSCITGNEKEHYFDYTINFIRENVGTRNLRGLLIGCQESNPSPEVQLVQNGLFDRVEVFDIAQGLLKKQKELARQKGFSNIEYHIRDCNAIQLEEEAYDLIYAVGTVHHIEKLDTLFHQIRRGLKKKGIFVMREYVGPNRFQFTDEQVSIINEILSLLPDKYRTTNNGYIKDRFARPDVNEVISHDPSESVSSQDILPVMQKYLTTIKLNFTGGTILHPLLSYMGSNFEGNEDADAILRLLILYEKTLVAKNILPSDYVFCIAKKSNAEQEA